MEKINLYVCLLYTSDMFTAYGKYKEAFARLEVTPDDVSSLSTAQEAQAVVENFITNREMDQRFLPVKDGNTVCIESQLPWPAVEVHQV